MSNLQGLTLSLGGLTLLEWPDSIGVYIEDINLTWLRNMSHIQGLSLAQGGLTLVYIEDIYLTWLCNMIHLQGLTLAQGGQTLLEFISKTFI